MNLLKYRVRFFWLIGLFLLSVMAVNGIGLGAERIRIEVHEDTEVSNSWITLGDIAFIEGVEGEERALIDGIRLGKALLPGYECLIPGELILICLQKKGYLVDELDLKIPDLVRAKTASQVVNGKDLVSFAEDYLQERLEYTPVRIRLRTRIFPRDLVIPDRDYQLEVLLNSGGDLRGDISLQVLIRIDGSIYKRVWLGFEVAILQEVYVARRSINKGERLKRDDFSLEIREITNYRGDLITDFSNTLVEEGIVNIAIKKGEILSSYYLKRPDIVSFGDLLEAELITGNLTVSTRVKACQQGKKDEVILVENLKTGYRFKARIIDAQLVRIE
jgi:flagellar basal body P-ring formation protein FlgA